MLELNHVNADTESDENFLLVTFPLLKILVMKFCDVRFGVKSCSSLQMLYLQDTIFGSDHFDMNQLPLGALKEIRIDPSVYDDYGEIFCNFIKCGSIEIATLYFLNDDGELIMDILHQLVLTG